MYPAPQHPTTSHYLQKLLSSRFYLLTQLQHFHWTIFGCPTTQDLLQVYFVRSTKLTTSTQVGVPLVFLPSMINGWINENSTHHHSSRYTLFGRNLDLNHYVDVLRPKNNVIGPSLGRRVSSEEDTFSPFSDFLFNLGPFKKFLRSKSQSSVRYVTVDLSYRDECRGRDCGRVVRIGWDPGPTIQSVHTTHTRWYGSINYKKTSLPHGDTTGPTRV